VETIKLRAPTTPSAVRLSQKSTNVFGQELACGTARNLGARIAPKDLWSANTPMQERRPATDEKKRTANNRISWAQAKKLATDDENPRRKRPGLLYWLGSAKHNNEQHIHLQIRGLHQHHNNVDHQARICHQQPLGVANTWGYGADQQSTSIIPRRSF
jgi:anaerobic selenocysteine-containing dehydrogenase